MASWAGSCCGCAGRSDQGLAGGCYSTAARSRKRAHGPARWQSGLRADARFARASRGTPAALVRRHTAENKWGTWPSWIARSAQPARLWWVKGWAVTWGLEGWLCRGDASCQLDVALVDGAVVGGAGAGEPASGC